MTKIFIFLFAISGIFGAPKVCLNMIVKNESKVIERCLASVKPLIDYWVIVDTGSTDGTQEIIQQFMKEIPGDLYERPWVNFSHNRNEALYLAKDKAEYLLIVDADDILSYPTDFKMPFLDKDSYLMPIQYYGLTYYRTQLIKCELDWRWEGVVHEVLMCDEAKTTGTLDGLKMVILGGGNRSQDPEKYLNDANALKKALENDPGNTRITFYLAQSYRDAHEVQLSLEYYEKRVLLGGWDQEVFWSLYQIAELLENLNEPEEVVAKAYIKAFQYRPTRIEPLYRLTQYYRLKENYFLGYLIAKQGLKIPHSSDVLFVETWIYDYGLLLEYSICSYWIGEYEEAFKACIELLAIEDLPVNIIDCVRKNLKFVLEKLPFDYSRPGFPGLNDMN